MEPIEAAFLFIGDKDAWHARITYKCSECGRRNYVLQNGKTKSLDDSLPLTVKCKLGHETVVVPYRWNKKEQKFS
jgi:DNA-directed RNA polymerase subunit RPC12/RpoP